MAVVEYEEMVTTPEEAHVRTRVYAKRWVVLAVHMLFCACSSFHWVQYAVVGDQVARYYCVPAARVQDTSLAFMGCVAALVLPACFLIDVMGVEWGQLLGGLLMMLGSWFKVTAVAPGRFSLLLLAQAAAGVAELSVAGAAPRLAAAWFDARQLPFARAAAALGSELGMALGLLLPPTIVRPHDDPQDIGGDLRRLGSSTAVASTVVMVLVVLLFRDRPRLPPSSEQACLRSRRAPATPRGFASTLRRLLTSRDYLLLLAAHGLARGALSAILTQLNPVVTRHFPDGQEFTGRVGLVIVAVGLLGCALFGAALRWTRKHKQMTIAAYILMAAATCIFAFALRTEDPLCVYFSAGVMGSLFLVGFPPMAVEMSAEMTHPESESLAGSLMHVPGHALGILLTAGFTWLLQSWGDLPAALMLSAAMACGAALSTCLPGDNRRLPASGIVDDLSSCRGDHAFAQEAV